MRLLFLSVEAFNAEHTPMRQPLLAVLLFSLGCGGATADSPFHTGAPSEELGSVPRGAGTPLSCSLPDVPAGSGPSTSAPWELVQLQAATYPTAICNDGTSAVYMIRRNPNSTKWLIWLEGGGSCSDSKTCAVRWQAMGPKRMSSKHYLEQDAQGTLAFPQEGVFSINPLENPTFHDANLIKIPYCSSDVWSGERAGDPSKPVSEVGRWHFRGRAILQGVFRELMLRARLSAATDIVYAGGSAGAGGVYATVDDVGAMMPSGARFMGMPDAAFRFDHPSYDPVTGRESTAVPTTMWTVRSTAASNWGGRGDASCDATATTPDGHLHCREPAYLTTHGHIRTPLLIINSQYDHNPLSELGVELVDGMAQTESERAYVQRFSARMRELLMSTDSIHSYFADYTSNHVTANSSSTGTLTIEGVSTRDAIDAFFRRPCTSQRRVEAPIPGTP
jgi:hypothetical protein